MAANRAMGYSDYYKSNGNNTPGESDTMMQQKDMMKPKDMTEMSPEDRRKMAIRRRLMKKRAGK